MEIINLVALFSILIIIQLYLIFIKNEIKLMSQYVQWIYEDIHKIATQEEGEK